MFGKLYEDIPVPKGEDDGNSKSTDPVSSSNVVVPPKSAPPSLPPPTSSTSKKPPSSLLFVPRNVGKRKKSIDSINTISAKVKPKVQKYKSGSKITSHTSRRPLLPNASTTASSRSVKTSESEKNETLLKFLNDDDDDDDPRDEEYDPLYPNNYAEHCKRRNHEKKMAIVIEEDRIRLEQQRLRNEQIIKDHLAKPKDLKIMKAPAALQGGNTERPAGRGRGRGMTMPAWMTQGK